MPDDITTNTGAGNASGGAGGNAGGATGADPTEKLESGKTHAMQAAEDLRAAAEAKAAQLRAAAEQKAQDLRNRAEQTYQDVRSRAENYRTDTEQWVRDNPTRAVMTALGAGFILGLIFRR